MTRNYIYAAITIFLWGSSAAVSALLLKSIDTVSTLFYASTIAFIFLLIVNIARGKINEILKIKALDMVKIIVYGLIGIYAYNLFLYYGMTLIPAQQAFIINYLWPIMTVLFSCILLKDKMTVRKIISMLLSFFGVAIVATGGNFTSLAGINIIGILTCVAAAVCYGLFTVLTIKVDHDKSVTMMLYYGASAVLCFITTRLQGTDIPWLSASQWPIMLWSGILVYGLAFTLWAFALQGGETSKIANLAYFTPFISLIWIYFIIGEPIALASIVGLLFIIAGVVLQIFKISK